MDRVPAWKKLGLTLSKFDQPQDHVTDQSGHAVGAADLSNLQHNASVTTSKENGKAHERLGKRKLAAEPVDHADRALKKAKYEETNCQTHLDLPSTTASNNGPEHEANTATSQTGKSKGDPNYRKKKGANNVQSRQKFLSVPEPILQESLGGEDGVTRDRRSKTPSLSPGRLDDDATLRVSTETDFPATAVTPKRQLAAIRNSSKGTLSSSPPRTDRRKSVTFTPDTKTVDGNSASNLFKKWAQEQKNAGTDADFSQTAVSQFTPPPAIHPANDLPVSSPATSTTGKKSKKTDKKPDKPKLEEKKELIATAKPAKAVLTTSQTKKKNPSRYISYLVQYHTHRQNWKFNKAKQNDVLDNALNIFRIPEEHSEALIEYVRGLQGAGVITRLKQRCTTIIDEIDTADSKMTDVEMREVAKQEALQDRLCKEKKRRQLDADIENMYEISSFLSNSFTYPAT
jgi:hypothetical protein